MQLAHDPNGVGVDNGNFAGLPFDVANAQLILIGMPWEVTVSYRSGTALGVQATLEASRQLDLYDLDNPTGWQQGIYMLPISGKLLEANQQLRSLASGIIEYQGKGLAMADNASLLRDLETINAGCLEAKHWLLDKSQCYLNQGKYVGVIGGDHSVPLGYLQALSEHYPDFGVLQIDAHADLRDAYEGFEFSHASIMFNALRLPQINRLVQVGVRDLCQAEVDQINDSNGRVVTYYDAQLKADHYEGSTWRSLCQKIVQQLPQKVYVSFDVDGLDPKLCPNTGTPVPGGLELEQVFCLLREVVRSDREIIGFDVSEIGNDEWDGNVAARIVYKLANLMFLTKKAPP